MNLSEQVISKVEIHGLSKAAETKLTSIEGHGDIQTSTFDAETKVLTINEVNAPLDEGYVFQLKFGKQYSSNIGTLFPFDY